MWREYHINYICHWLGIQPKAISYDKENDKIIISENPEDYDMEEEWLLSQDLKWFYSYGSYWPFVNELKKYGKDLSFKDEEFRELFGKYLKNWAASLRKRNIPFDRFYVEFQDEPEPEIYDAYVETMQFIRKTVPEFQTFGTMPTWISREFIERCKDLIDLWIPWEPRITERASGPEELEFYKSTGKKFLPYLCSIGLPQINMQTYCRFRGIRSYLMGNDGFSQWGFNSWRANEWFPSDAKDAWNGFMFYHGTNGAIVCPRMEAYREAAEDLHMLLTAKEFLKNNDDAELKSLVSQETLNAVLSADDTYKTYEWRTALLKRLAAIAK
ncbi:MAG: DUF4091 domain-containing protein [Lentisphaeria bacterium]|nr:DUF4091 domain-containing protein [Lentisphaeria bacterium]